MDISKNTVKYSKMSAVDKAKWNSINSIYPWGIEPVTYL